MSAQTGSGGVLGMTKHRTMGTPGQNRRGLQGLARDVNRMTAKPRARLTQWAASIRELMGRERHR